MNSNVVQFNRSVQRQTRNLNQANRPKLREGQVRRIVALLVTIVLVMYVQDSVMAKMTAENAVKVRSGLLSIFRAFVNIVNTVFAGHTRAIEAGASSIAAVIYRKFQTGRLTPNVANLAVASSAFAIAYRTGGSSANFIKGFNTYRNSWVSRFRGNTAANAENLRRALVTMLAWLVSSLKYFGVQNIAYFVKEELRIRGVYNTRKNTLVNAGTTMLRLAL